MTDSTEPRQHADDSVHATDSNVTVLRLGEDIKWLTPFLIIGATLFAISIIGNLFMYFEYRSMKMAWGLAYTRSVNVDAELKRLNVPPERIGPALPPP